MIRSRRLGLVGVSLLLVWSSACSSATESRHIAGIRFTRGVSQFGIVLSGDTARLGAVATDQQGLDIPTAPIAWRANPTSFLTVDATGLVRLVPNGPPAGSGYVIASATEGARTVSDSVALSIVCPADISARLEPASLTLRVGQGASIVASTRGCGGKTIIADSYTWSVADTAIAYVDTEGHVDARRVGTTVVTAIGKVFSAPIRAPITVVP